MTKIMNPAHGGTGSGDCSLLASENTSGNSLPPPEIRQPFSPDDCARRALILDLSEESITIALGFGLNLLYAAQRGDDAAAIGEFGGFHAAAHTAAGCARELRDFVEANGQ
jgi:hypothetical protein